MQVHAAHLQTKPPRHLILLCTEWFNALAHAVYLLPLAPFNWTHGPSHQYGSVTKHLLPVPGSTPEAGEREGIGPSSTKSNSWSLCWGNMVHCWFWLVLWSRRLLWHLEGVCEELRQHRADEADFAYNVHLHTDRGVKRTWEKPRILWCSLSALNTVKKATCVTINFIAAEHQIMTIIVHLRVRTQEYWSIYLHKKLGIVATK